MSDTEHQEKQDRIDELQQIIIECSQKIAKLGKQREKYQRNLRTSLRELEELDNFIGKQ